MRVLRRHGADRICAVVAAPRSMKAAYRVMESDEFWTVCNEVCAEGVRDKVYDTLQEAREAFLKIYAMLAPPLGTA